jgi:hypothetical protein
MNKGFDLDLVPDRTHLDCDPDMVVADRGHGLAILDAEFGFDDGVVVEREEASSMDSSHSGSPFPSDSFPDSALVLELVHTSAVPCPLAYPFPCPFRHPVNSSSPD